MKAEPELWAAAPPWRTTQAFGSGSRYQLLLLLGSGLRASKFALYKQTEQLLHEMPTPAA